MKFKLNVFTFFLLLTGLSQTIYAEIELYKRIDLSPHSIKNCRMSIGDFNGDKKIDFLFNDGRKTLKAFDHEGNLLWEKNNPQDPGVAEKYHNFTLSVYDIDLDGKDEIICFLELNGKNALAVLDGETGNIQTSIVLPFDSPRDHAHWGNDNFYMQNHTAIANLRGRPVPQDILAMHVSKQKVAAYKYENDKLTQLWFWVSDADSYASGHYSYPYDIDNDGRDEVLAGVDVLDENGNRLWKMQLHPWKPSRPDWGMDHVDALSCADIIPEKPGLEIAVAAATGAWLYSANGDVIWHHPSKVTDPVNGILGGAGIQEVLLGHFRPNSSNIDMIFYSEYMSGSNTVGMYDKNGNSLVTADQKDGPRRVITYAMDWDGDRSTDEIYSRKGIYDYNFKRLSYSINWRWVQTKDVNEFPPIVCDVQGDQREEIIWYDEDEIIIIKNSAQLKGPVLTSPWEDIRYRLRYANNNHCNAIYYNWKPVNKVPKISISSSTKEGLIPLTVEYKSNSSSVNDQLSYSWDFGDGGTSIRKNATHNYMFPGTYKAVLTVRNETGHATSDTLTVVAAQPLKNQIKTTSTNGIAPLNITFQSMHSGGFEPYSHVWNFGDGSTSSQKNPSHIFKTGGSFSIESIVTDKNGYECRDTVQVNVQPAASSIQIADIVILEKNESYTADRIRAGEWYDMKIYPNNAGNWNNIQTIYLKINSPSITSSSSANAKGIFNSQSNYMISMSIPERKIWAKETRNSDVWTEVTNKTGEYVDGQYYKIDSSTGISIRLKMLNNVSAGSWQLSAFITEKNNIISPEFLRSIPVQSIKATPTAVLQITPNVNGKIKLLLTPSIRLNNSVLQIQFIENDLSQTLLQLEPNSDHSLFTGYLVISDKICSGPGKFKFDRNTFIDINGNIGEAIISGSSLIIDRTPPGKPSGIEITGN